MATEYHQIPSSKGVLALDASSEPADPWLVSNTKSLTLDWKPKANTKQAPPSLFDSDDAEASSWKTVVPQPTNSNASPPKQEDKQRIEKQNIMEPIKPPKAKQFTSTSSNIDAWTVIADASSMAVKQASMTKTAKTKATKSEPQAHSAVSASVEADEPTEEERVIIEAEFTRQNRYKTELCKSFNDTGICRYGTKCQFAHGREELRTVVRHPKYKTEICKTFHNTGTCPYGIRCRFIHTRSKTIDPVYTMPFSEPIQDIDDEPESNDPADKNTAASGAPVPQWSKSWIPTSASLQIKKPSKIQTAAVTPAPASLTDF